MICPRCNLDLTPLVLDQCRVLSCPNKKPVNTSGKVNTLFVVEGSGFAIEDIIMFSSSPIDPPK